MTEQDGLEVAGLPEPPVQGHDTRPYALPASLSLLRGPTGGVVVLPHSVLWAPGDGRVDLDAPGGATMAYAAVISEGTAQEQVAALNADRLMAVWDDLLLPRRARQLRDSSVPELTRAVPA